MSFTVTVNMQVAVFPDASVAVAATVVVPFGKNDPDAGLAITATPGQLSVAVTVKFTTAPHWFGAFAVMMFAGQLMIGGTLSLTVTVKLQLPVLGDAARSDAEQLTVVTPFGNAEPEAGLHVTDRAPSQLSVAVGAKLTTALQAFVAVNAFTFVQPLSAGATLSVTVTVNVQVPVLGAAARSDAEQLTVVTPFGNVAPLAGLQVTGREPSQLSEAVGVV